MDAKQIPSDISMNINKLNKWLSEN
jgi:hypothetical protein